MKRRTRDKLRIASAIAGAIGYAAMPCTIIAQVIAIDDEPMAVFGGDDRVLGHVADALRIGSTVVVLDSQARQIVAFDLAGRDRLWARAGRGPGEMADPRNLWRTGDTVFVYDSGAQRITGFTFDGAVASELAMRVPIPVERVMPLGDEGWLLQEKASLVPAKGDRPGRDTIAYYLTDRGFGNPAEYAESAGIMSDVLRVDGRRFMRLAPFSPFPIVRRCGSCVILGVTDSPRLRILALDGEEEASFHLQQRALTRVTPDHRERFIEEQLARMREGDRALFRRAAGDLSFPETLPLFVTFQIDPRGWIWVQDYDPFAFPREWTLHTFEGEPLGRVTVPFELDIHEIGEDYVLGSGTDDIRQPLVYVLRLVVTPTHPDPPPSCP